MQSKLCLQQDELSANECKTVSKFVIVNTVAMILIIGKHVLQFTKSYIHCEQYSLDWCDAEVVEVSVVVPEHMMKGTEITGEC